MALRTESYTYQIQRSYKNLNLGMSGEAKTVSNNLMKIFASRLMQRANILATTDESKTLGLRDFENAISIWLVKYPEYTKDLLDYAHQAVEKFQTSVKSTEKSENGTAKPLLKSTKAGITMPVTRLEHYLRKVTLRDNVSERASVFFAAVLDKVCQDICSSAGVKAVEEKKQRVTHKHISQAIKTNPSLSFVFSDTVLGGGILPFIPFRA